MTSEQTELERLASHLEGDVGLTGKVTRAIQIARHYRWSQIVRRGMSVARKRLSGNRRIDAVPVPEGWVFRNPKKLVDVAGAVIESCRDHISHKNGNLSRGTLSLLNQTVEMGWPIDWKMDLSHQPQLWRFQLQYHEYLMSFLADNDQEHPALETVQAFLLHWIKEHLPENVDATGDSWHPYCISRRIPVWLWILGEYDLDDEVRRSVTSCLYQQAEYLSRHLELDLCGNHLFENLTALVLSACCFEGEASQRWMTIASSHLHRELAKQILPHGEHFELSPMYHCQILGNILKMICLLENRDPDLGKTLLASSQRMPGFLQFITPPDGEFPLLGDSGFGEAPNSELIRRLAELASVTPGAPGSNENTSGPYWRFNSNRANKSDWLLFDRGAACCDELPAHGHCDLLNIVASMGGRRWIVDSGNFDYENGSMRRYCRSSMAHNVMTVDGQNQCQIWSSFRMGRRARIIEKAEGRTEPFVWASASHDGYRQMGVPRMVRLVAIAAEPGVWVCADFAHGKPTGSLVGYLHISYDVDIQEVPDSEPDARTYILGDNALKRKLTFFGADQTSVADGWQCSAFGERKKNPVIVYRQTNETARPLGWVLYDMDKESVTVESRSNGLVIKTRQPATTFTWKF